MFKEVVDPIVKILRDYKIKYADFLNCKKDELLTLSGIVSELNESWSQSWIGFHSNLYYYNFQKPPSIRYRFDSEWGSLKEIPKYWEEKSYEDIVLYVESRSGRLSLAGIQNEITPLVEEIRNIQSKILTDLPIFLDNQKFTNELGIFENIKEYGWGTTVQDLLMVRMPKNYMPRDSFSVYQEIKAPPHIIYQNEVFVELSKIQSIDEFLENVEMLFRRIELKNKFIAQKAQNESLCDLMNIFFRFHAVSRQLHSRYDGRSTLDINDEYDVQDLLHSLLKLYFYDVRTEEWTPSYAGSSSRMDFLLKDEKIVIEVKKTRTNLESKQLGEQLILDIVKYKKHPDCKTLLCFVYDPEGRIGNPTGLENDLNLMSTEELQVIVNIEPKN